MMHHFKGIGHEGRRRPSRGADRGFVESFALHQRFPLTSGTRSCHRGLAAFSAARSPDRGDSMDVFGLGRNYWYPPSSLTQVDTGSYVAAMRSVGLKTLNNKLSEYVRLAAAGETVLVTDRDRVVAEIVPPRVERSPILADAILADAVRKGWLTPPATPGSGPPPVPPPIMSLDQLLRELDEDRRER